MGVLSRHIARTGFLLVLLASATPLAAQLASPGKLSRAHASLEGVNNCTKCHNFGEKSFRNNCLDCHKEIKTRVDAGRGYHYFTRKLECAKCHKEHHGREFELVRWNPESFDHKQTGFLLEGRHDGLDCRRCHRAENIKENDIRRKGGARLKNTYLGLSTACENCHDDEHRGQLKDCASCHQTDDWKKTRFSHDKARFRLEGRHAQAACASCHPEKDDGKKRNGDTRFMQFRGVSFSTCTACHEDHHKGAFGSDCRKCHTPAGWKQLRIAEGSFDHSKTHFPLEGRHAAVGCAACHTGGDFGKFRGADLERCTTCHQDSHAGQFAARKDGGDCASCHDVNGFTPASFEPSRHAQTRFPLEGAHEAVPCRRCHAHAAIGGKETARFRWTDLSCQACHRDPHAGQLDARVAAQGCTGCHNTESWYVMRFEHSETRFPLTGRHRDVLCERCHVKGDIGGSEVTLFRFEDTRCERCHADPHRGQFSAADGAVGCERCHETAGWRSLHFDHATMSRFSLTGRHAALSCDRCHTIESDAAGAFRRFRPLDVSCSNCHTTGR